jgi:phenylalanyl-tRNA synthetase alpha chain
MIDKIRQLMAEVGSFDTDSPAVAEEFRVRLFGKKGDITLLFEQFKEVPPQDKRAFGQELNVLKTLAISKLKELQEKHKKSFQIDPALDLTLPGDPDAPGLATPGLPHQKPDHRYL